MESDEQIDFTKLRKRDGKVDPKWKKFENQAVTYFEKKKCKSLNGKEKAGLHQQVLNLSKKTGSSITGSEVIELKVNHKKLTFLDKIMFFRNFWRNFYPTGFGPWTPGD